MLVVHGIVHSSRGRISGRGGGWWLRDAVATQVVKVRHPERKSEMNTHAAINKPHRHPELNGDGGVAWRGGRTIRVWNWCSMDDHYIELSHPADYFIRIS